MDKYRIDYFPAGGGHVIRYYLTEDAARADADYIRTCLNEKVFIEKRIADTKYYDIIEMLL